MKDPIIGKKIIGIRDMTKQEMEDNGWDEYLRDRPSVLVLEDETILFASQDPEGNGPGALFGVTKDGGGFAY
jgi:hypothetical protein